MENEVELDLDLTNITVELGSAYRSWKNSERLKNRAKTAFFQVANEQQDGLAEKYVTLPGITSEKLAHDELEKAYPEWNIEALRKCHSGYEAILTENPEYKPFSYVNPNDGYLYQKQVVSGSVLLDDERIKEENPELYERVTYVPEPERVLRPLEQLDDKTLAALQEYVYFGKPTVKLAAPRKAKPEEL